MIPSLIERLEQATEGSPELDAEIARSQGYKVSEDNWWLTESFDGRPLGALHPLPQFSTSFDAALLLVPDLWTWDIDATAPECGVDARIYEDKRIFGDARTCKGTADTPALALCIAALRAREAA